MSSFAYQTPTEIQMTNAEALVARFAERWTKPDADALRDLMHPETRNLIPPMSEPGDREAVVEHFRGVLKTLPDLTLEIVRWAPTGDAVMLEWRAFATIAGRPLSWSGVDRFNIRDDRMYEASVYWDTRGLAQKIAAAVADAGTSLPVSPPASSDPA